MFLSPIVVSRSGDVIAGESHKCGNRYCEICTRPQAGGVHQAREAELNCALKYLHQKFFPSPVRHVYTLVDLIMGYTEGAAVHKLPPILQGQASIQQSHWTNYPTSRRQIS